MANTHRSRHAGCMARLLWCFGRSRSAEQCGRRPGHVHGSGQNKLVQHFEGGIIREIAVKEGDVVEENQVLIRMDDTAANAKLRRLVLKKYRLLAMKARLEAEMRGSETIETPTAFSEDARDQEIKGI